MPISRSNLERELVPGLKTLIGLNYNDYQQEWREIFDVEQSRRSFEEEQKLVGFGRAAEKPEGESLQFDEEAGETWSSRYIMRTFALGFILTEEAIEDQLYDSLGARYAKQLGRSMAKSKEYECANVLNFAFSSQHVGGDGVSLCNAQHKTYSGLFNSNLAEVGADLNEATLENAIVSISQWVDERGMIIAAKPRKLILPSGLQFIAKRILSSEYRPGSSDNDINALKATGSIPEGFVVNHYISDPDAWFIKTDIPDGLKLFQRMALKKGKEGDFNTGNVKFKARERYGVGWTDPLGLWGSQGAA